MLEPLSVLAVCTANRCRSPLMEFALRRRLGNLGLPWLVSSAGTRAQPELRAHPYTERLLAEHQQDASGWRTRRISPQLIRAADLIVTASIENRNEVLWLYPQAARRTILLQQLADFCAASKHDLTYGGGSRSAVMAQLEGARERFSGLGRDLPDPVGRPYYAFRRVDRLIESASDQLLNTTQLRDARSSSLDGAS